MATCPVRARVRADSVAVGTYVALAVVYGAITLLKKAAEAAKRQQAALERQVGEAQPTREARTRPLASRPTTMEELLREMRGQLEGAQQRKVAGPVTTRPGGQRRLPAAPRIEPVEDDIEGESIEVGERIVVRAETRRLVPAVVDYDDSASALVQRRINAAQARNVAWSPEGHADFDSRIRTKEPAKAPAASRGLTLRRAIIWHEVLSPPVALREEG